MQHAPHRRRFGRIRMAPPAQEPNRRIDGKQRDAKEQNQLGDEGAARKIERGAFLEVEHPQQPHHEEHPGRHAEHEVGKCQAAGGARAHVVADDNELDDERRDERKAAK